MGIVSRAVVEVLVVDDSILVNRLQRKVLPHVIFLPAAVSTGILRAS
jgi:hypothetical protein